MSCGCNSTPCCCSGQIAPAICCTPTTESVEYTFENQNLIGVGVFNGETDNLVGFRGIASDTLALTVTLDAPNNAIIISFNDELLIDDIPTATESIRGIAEVATQAETNAGTLDDKIITPLKLNDRTATETRTGIAEIATQAEVTTGTDDTRIITPLKLATFAGAQMTTRVFADAVARAAAVPTFNGQLGVQLDTDALIMATGTVAGSFSPNIVIGGTLTVLGDISAAVAQATFASVISDEASFDGGALSVISGVGISTTATFSFEPGTTFQISGAPAANSVIIGRNLGAADALALTEFLTTENVQTGWSVTNPSVTRTLDVAAASLGDVRAVLGTLINDLKAVLLPAT